MLGLPTSQSDGAGTGSWGRGLLAVLSPRLRNGPVHVFATGLILALLLGGSSYGGSSQLPWTGPGSIGTVQTLAGPGFCDKETVVEAPDNNVGALAVDASGTTFLDAGSLKGGLIRKADSLGTVLVSTGAPLTLGPKPPRGGLGQVAGAGRLAADGRGGFFLAVGAKVTRVQAPRTPAPNVGAATGATSLETVAGDPSARVGGIGSASTGDGGPAASARFMIAASLAADESGNLYVAEQDGRESLDVRIRFINRSAQPVTFYPSGAQKVVVAPGNIDTIAGGIRTGNTGDGGPARLASLSGVPPAMASLGGRLYVALYSPPNGQVAAQARVRMINLSGEPMAAHGLTILPGEIGTVAGGAVAGFSGDGAAAGRAKFSYVPGIATDAKGALYLADNFNHRVRRVDSSGLIITVAGTGKIGAGGGGFNGNYQLARQALLNSPADVKVGPEDKLYISDGGNRQLRVVTSDGIISPGPGNGAVWSCRERKGGLGGLQAGDLSAVAATSDGAVYFTDRTGNRLMKVEGSEKVVYIPAELQRPAALAANTGRGLYLRESGRISYLNRTSKAVRINGEPVPSGLIRPVVKPADSGASRGGGPVDAANPLKILQSGEEAAIAADPVGNVFSSAAGGGVVQIDPGGKVTAFAGPRANSPLSGCCARPAGLALDSSGNLYVSDAQTFRVWFINRGASPVTIHGRKVAAGQVESVAGNGMSALGGEGLRAAETSLRHPRGVAVDRKGNLYIVEQLDHTIRKVDATGIITTVVGGGQPGFNGDGLKGKLTNLNLPTNLAVDRCGNLLIADQGNDRIRRLNLSTGCSEPTEVRARGAKKKGGSPLVSFTWVLTAALAAAILIIWKRRVG